MSDVDVDPEDDVGNHDADYSHQACYIFKPISFVNIDLGQPAKKRCKTQHIADNESISSFPLLNQGAESPEFARLRSQTYKNLWARKDLRIAALVDEVNEADLTKIIDFIELPTSQLSDRLHAALIVSGPGGSAQIRLKERWGKNRLRSAASVIIQLSASHCTNLQTTLKNIIKSTISQHGGQDKYQDFLNKHKNLIPMNFDLELLQIYVSENNLHNIVLSVLDVETFDMTILSDLLSMLSSWSGAIPFTILLGIATTVELFESRLPKSIIDVLDTTVFKLQSSERTLEQVLDDIQSDPDPGLYFGSATMTSLEELVQSQSTTIEIFVSAVKYIYMSHFFANSLSVLLSDPPPSFPEKSLCTAVRNTTSFQQYCDSLASSKTKASRAEISKLLTDDSHLLAAAITAVRSPPTITPISASKTKVQPSFTLSEATTISTRKLLHPFHPRSRHALERALSKPSDYLGCDCCSHSDKTATLPSSAPPTSTLYTLLQEAGTIVNVRDLYDAFCARSFPTADPDLDNTLPQSNGDKADRTQLSAFYTALAELRMLGFVKSSTSALVKKRAMATSGMELEGGVAIGSGRARDKNGDVDFIAKTGWFGM